MAVKKVVGLKPDELTFEIKALINREADMMNRGRSIESLRGLRERIVRLFLSYMMNEEMNPEIGLAKKNRKHKQITIGKKETGKAIY